MRTLGRHAVVTLVAVACAFGCRAASPGQPPPAATPQAAAPVAAPAGKIWLIFVDDLHLDFRNTGRLRNFFKRISSELVQDGDSFAVRSSGPSSLAIDLTTDRTLLEGAVRKVSGAGSSPGDILDTARRGQIPNEVIYRANVALSAAHEFAGSLEPANGRRRALIYISNGYDFDPSSDAASAPPAAKPAGGRNFSVGRLRKQIWALTRQAKTARVRIFPVDPRALAPDSAPPPGMDAAAWENYLARARNSLRFIAEQTGGFVEGEDLAGSLTRISRAMRDLR